MTFPKPVVIFLFFHRAVTVQQHHLAGRLRYWRSSRRGREIVTLKASLSSQRCCCCCSRRHLFSKQVFPWEYFISLSVLRSSQSGLLLSTYVATVQRLVCQTRQEWLINYDWHSVNTAKISVWHSWKAQCKQHLHKNSFASLRRTTFAACAKTVFQDVRMCSNKDR